MRRGEFIDNEKWGEGLYRPVISGGADNFPSSSLGCYTLLCVGQPRGLAECEFESPEKLG